MVSDWEARRAAFKESYAEVLAALKHQDDKLGRSLTALAFVTAGGVALYTQLGRTERLAFDAHTLPVTDFFFVLFLTSIVIALGFTLAAIGPSTLYRGQSVPTETPRSLLFYASIRTDEQWESYLEKNAEWLDERLARNFHSEASTLASRVHYKIARSREAAVFLNLAFISLSMLGIFSVQGLTASTRWWIAGPTLLALAVMPLWDGWQMHLFKFPEGSPKISAYVQLGVSGALGLGLVLLAPCRETHWLALGYLLGLSLASRFAFVHEWFAKLLPLCCIAGVILVVIAL